MLRYVGKGFSLSSLGVPARDLTDEEVKKYGGEKFLVGTGLYARPLKPMKSATKGMVEGRSENQESEE